MHVRKRGDWTRDSSILPQHYGLSVSLSPSPPSLSLCLVTHIIVNQRPYRFCLRLSRYIDETRAILLAGEKANVAQGYVLANLPLRERRAVVDFFPTPSMYAYICATEIRFSLRRDEQ